MHRKNTKKKCHFVQIQGVKSERIKMQEPLYLIMQYV